MCKKLVYLISLLFVLAITPGVTNADLVAYWPLDEGDGDVAYDAIGNNDGQITGCTWVMPGKIGAAAIEGSGGDEINCGAGPTPTTEDLTLAWWMVDNHDSYGTIMDKSVTDSGYGYNILVRSTANEDSPLRFRIGGWQSYGGWGEECRVPSGAYSDGVWVHVVCTYDSATDTATIYINGKVAENGANNPKTGIAGPGGYCDGVNNPNTPLYIRGGEETFDGILDEVAIWDTALTADEVLDVYNLGVLALDPKQADNPNPSHEAPDACRNIVLSWTPGIFADKHDVYFGVDEAKVTDANRVNPLGVLIEQNHDADSYAIADLVDLDFGRTYFWRIDEVNAPPASTIFKGDVWRFTVEPFGFAIAGDDIIATASRYSEGKGPENTVNGSGLDDDDLHSTEGTDMWLSAEDGPQPTWIEYEFDKIYKLHEMLVWNHNTEFEYALGFGLKDVTVEYSTDRTEWTELATVPQFARAPGMDGYAHDTIVQFNGAPAKYVRLTADSNWGATGQYGLSEVRFLSIPVSPRDPGPQDGAEDMPLDLTLSWTEGRGTVTSEVYLGTDMQAVADSAVAPVSVAAAGCVSGYGPLSLDIGATYYWKVAAVNNLEDPNVWESNLWSFTTVDSLIVDDMESYGDENVVGEPGSRIWYTWKDGEGWDTPEPSYPGNATGSVLELGTDPAFDGQSLIYHYDNDGTNFLGTPGKNLYSETTAAIGDLPMIDGDWTKGGAKALSLQFYGDPNNAASATEQMYVKLNGAKVLYDGDMADITEPAWHEWLIDLTDFGINLANVTQISIGFGNEGSGTPGGSGTVYFDQIKLYPAKCVAKYGPAGDITNDCFVGVEDFVVLADAWHMPYLVVEYTFDADLSDTSGNGRHGIDVNSTSVHDGVLTLNGTNFVDIPLGAENPFDSARDDEPDHHAMAVYIHHWDNPSWGEVVYDNFYVGASTAEDDPFDGEWHTMVVTYEADDQWFMVYLDGVPGGGTTMNPNIPDIADDTVRIGGSLNTVFPYETGAGHFSGDIDNVRIFNFPLSYEDVLTVPGLVSGPADLNKDGAVDFRDYKIVADTWLDEKLWP